MKDTAKDRISAVIPIYGSFDSRRAILSVESILNQRNINLEVVVFEQNESSRLNGALPREVKYTFLKHTPAKDMDGFNPGFIRDSAIDISTGKFIYTNDADVVFLDRDYLAKCLELLIDNPELVLQRPPMRRLPLDNFEDFWRLFNEKGIWGAVSLLDFSQKYIATTDGTIRPLKVVEQESEYYTKTFTTSIGQFQRYIEGPSLKGKEPMIWSEDLHCGGNFFRREHYDAIGGYCQEFINWGCEDSDLQWKFAHFNLLEFFPYAKEFEVLHLDHPKEYFSPEMWKKNEEICAERRKVGAKEARRRDIKNGKRKRIG